MKKGSNQHAGIPAPSQTKAAEMLNVSRDTVQQARKVSEGAIQEVQDMVTSGELSMNAAASVARLPETEQIKAVSGGVAGVKDAIFKRSLG